MRIKIEIEAQDEISRGERMHGIQLARRWCGGEIGVGGDYGYVTRASDCSSTVRQRLGGEGLGDAHWDECPFRLSWLDGVGGTTL